MSLSRRTLLMGAGALPLAAGNFGFSAFAQTASAVPRVIEVPPVLFVHGNGDHAALWLTTVWRMESNGVPRERMSAINFTDPLARTDDTVAQPNRSSTEDQLRELTEAIKELKRRSGAPRVALVGNSRGGNSIRSYIKNGGVGDISHAVLCGVPNHGVYDWDDGLGNEFNGRGPFLRGLNAGESEVKLSGLVTGTPGGIQTNRPVAGAMVEMYRVSPDTGERIGGAIHTSQTSADGRWGPAQADPSWYLEIVLTSAGSTTTHFYRSPFPRSSDIVHLRAARPLGPPDAGAGCILLMSRPRGYFGLPRDVVLFDGKEPADVKSGVPTDSISTLRLSAAEAGRPVVALFNQERIVARGWPASENRIAVAELTY